MGAKAIADSDILTQLVELNLNYNLIKGPGVIELTHSKKLLKLHNIQLAYNPIEKKGKQAWKRFQLMEGFKELHRKNQLTQVGEGLIGNFGVLVLLDFAFVSELETLDLRNNDLTDEAVIALSKSKKLEGLVSLNLSKNNITDVGAQALARSKNLKKLKKLNLNFNRIGDEGAKAIARSPRLANLESLKLGQNKIGTEGARALNESENLRNLIHPIFGFY